MKTFEWKHAQECNTLDDYIGYVIGETVEDSEEDKKRGYDYIRKVLRLFDTVTAYKISVLFKDTFGMDYDTAFAEDILIGVFKKEIKLDTIIDYKDAKVFGLVHKDEGVTIGYSGLVIAKTENGYKIASLRFHNFVGPWVSKEFKTEDEAIQALDEHIGEPDNWRWGMI